jgi:DNA-3-methyladenine glycosylase
VTRGAGPTGAGAPSTTRWARAFARPLPRAWYDRPTARVARELLGQWLVRRLGGTYRAARVVETEAYVARDPASHAYRGPTPRNRSMFAGPATLYVYRIHQVHCANVATRPGEAVLLRAAEALTPGLGSLSGPGRLARALAIDRSSDGWELTRSPLRIVAGPAPEEPIVAAPRVGVSRATERPLRFALGGHPAVSSPRPGARRRAAQRSFAQR